MPYVIGCPHCKQQMQMADNAAGKQFRCPKCQNAFVAPAPPAAAAGAPATDSSRRGHDSAGRSCSGTLPGAVEAAGSAIPSRPGAQAGSAASASGSADGLPGVRLEAAGRGG